MSLMLGPSPAPGISRFLNRQLVPPVVGVPCLRSVWLVHHFPVVLAGLVQPPAKMSLLRLYWVLVGGVLAAAELPCCVTRPPLCSRLLLIPPVRGLLLARTGRTPVKYPV